MAYATLTQLKEVLGIASTDTADDALLTTSIVRVQGQIDDYMRTIRAPHVTFEASSGVVRYYDGSGDRILITDDLVAIDSIHERETGNSSFATTWTTADYWLVGNRAPYNLLEVADSSTAQDIWTRGRRNIRITGTFGYSTAVPPQVTQAVIEETVRVFKAKDAGFSDVIGVDPNGQGGVPDGGAIPMSRALSARSKRILSQFAQPVIA